MINRDLLGSIEPFLQRREYISITGSRQSGKTTLLELLKRDLSKRSGKSKPIIETITFEDRRMLAQFEKNPVGLVRSYLPPGPSGRLIPLKILMIDEFQYAKNGGQGLKLVYDTEPEVKIVVTGSSSLEIKAKVGKYMVGRMLNFQLYPFSFGEYLRALHPRLEKLFIPGHAAILTWLAGGKLAKLTEGQDVFHEEFLAAYEDYVIWGGYPAAVLSQTVNERKKVLNDFYNNYLLKDIRGLLEMVNETPLHNLAEYVAVQAGNLISYHRLGQAVGLEYRKLKQYLRILEETFVCRGLRPFFRNRQKELSKSPKIYFYDTGFRNSIMEMFTNLAKRPDAGALIENTVWIQMQSWQDPLPKINFWRTKAGAEVDFVLQVEDRLLPLEVKYSSFGTAKASKSMAGFIDEFQPARAAVLTKDYWGLIKRGRTKILFIPVYYM